MNKQYFSNECTRQLTEYFNLLKQGKIDEKLRCQIQGFISAGEFMGFINRQEALQLMDDAHLIVFGMNCAQRKLNKEAIKSALYGEDDAYFETPAIERRKTRL